MTRCNTSPKLYLSTTCSLQVRSLDGSRSNKDSKVSPSWSCGCGPREQKTIDWEFVVEWPWGRDARGNRVWP